MSKKIIINTAINITFSAIIITFLIKIHNISNSYNTGESTFIDKYNYSILIPEGWGFFTKDPKDYKYITYKIHNDRTELITTSNSNIRNIFGFSRVSRRIAVETSKIITSIKSDSDWLLLNNRDVIRNFARNDQYINEIAFNKKQYHILKPGIYFIKKYKISPWMWAKYPNNFVNDTLYTKIYLR